MCVISVLILFVLIIASVRDIVCKEVDIREIMALITLMVVYIFMDDTFKMINSIWGLLFGLLLIVFSKLSKQALGFGDAIVLLVLGVGFGVYRVIYIFMISLIISSVIAIIFFLLKKVGRKTQLPFIPYITIAVMVMMISL